MTTMTTDKVLAVMDNCTDVLEMRPGCYYTDAEKLQEARAAVAALIAERDALAARVAELEADAGRYQFLRDAKKCQAMPSGRIGLITGNFGEDLDAAIDAARAEARNG